MAHIRFTSPSVDVRVLAAALVSIVTVGWFMTPLSAQSTPPVVAGAEPGQVVSYLTVEATARDRLPAAATDTVTGARIRPDSARLLHLGSAEAFYVATNERNEICLIGMAPRSVQTEDERAQPDRPSQWAATCATPEFVQANGFFIWIGSSDDTRGVFLAPDSVAGDATWPGANGVSQVPVRRNSVAYAPFVPITPKEPQEAPDVVAEEHPSRSHGALVLKRDGNTLRAEGVIPPDARVVESRLD